MGKIERIDDKAFQHIGEIGSDRIHFWNGERLDICDVWPGRHTSISNLEQNAALFRQQERKRFFQNIRKMVRHLFRQIGRPEHQQKRQSTRQTNFTSILAGTYAAALYKSQNTPEKDYRDD
jgi:hypothetical protein